MLGARQQGGTGLPTSAVPRSFPTATGGQRHPGELCHRRPPAMYSHVHDDDHVLWGGGTLDVPVGCRRGSAGLTHFGGGTPTLLGEAQEQSSATARAAGELCQECPCTHGCGDPGARSRDEAAAGERRRGCGTARHGRLPATRRSVPYQPNEL